MKKRTVNNYLRGLQGKYRIVKRGLKWHLVSTDGEPVTEKITTDLLSKIKIVQRMLSDGVDLPTALKYIGISLADYDMVAKYQELQRKIRVVKPETQQPAKWFICTSISNVAISLPRASGVKRADVKHRIVNEILPNAIHFGVDNAIRQWLRVAVENDLETISDNDQTN